MLLNRLSLRGRGINEEVCQDWTAVGLSVRVVSSAFCPDLCHHDRHRVANTHEPPQEQVSVSITSPTTK